MKQKKKRKRKQKLKKKQEKTQQLMKMESTFKLLQKPSLKLPNSNKCLSLVKPQLNRNYNFKPKNLQDNQLYQKNQ